MRVNLLDVPSFFPETDKRLPLYKRDTISERNDGKVEFDEATNMHSSSGGNLPFTKPTIFCRSGGTFVKLYSAAFKSNTLRHATRPIASMSVRKAKNRQRACQGNIPI